MPYVDANARRGSDGASPYHTRDPLNDERRTPNGER